jgi:tetratricopeptide (TPR) repeat protein
MDAFDTVFSHVGKAGRFAILSSDVGFISLFRHLLQDTFAVGQDRAAAYSNPSVFLSSLSGMNGGQRPPFFVMDRLVAGKESTFAVKTVRRLMPLAPVLLVTDEADAKRLMAYLEAGADGVLRKPATAESLLMRMAQVLDPPTPGAKAKRLAVRLIAKGEHRQALQSAWRLLAEEPDCAEAFQVIGDAHLALGNLAQAAEAYLNACRRARMALEPLGRLAEVYRMDGDQVRQLKCLQAMERLCDLNPDRKVDMGGIHYSQGQAGAAEGLFASALRLTVNELADYAAAVLSRIGDVYAEAEPGQAESYYRKSLEAKGPRLDAGDLATINRLGLNLRRRGDWRGAVREYKRALGLDPAQDHIVLYNIAMALAEGQEHAAAAKYVAAALKASPGGFKDNAPACYNIAHVFHKAEERARAAEYAEACLALEPRHGQAMVLRDLLRVH